MSLLDISDLSVFLAGKRVLDTVSFKVEPGEFIGLIGPNGAGKSTLLKAVLSFISAKGDIRIAGRDIKHLKMQERARLVAYLPQERDVAWAMPVETLVSLGRAPHRPGVGPLAESDWVAVRDAMRRMDVDTLSHRAATELSGGELARVLIARMLAQETPLLLADEPAAGLDPLHQITLMQTFASLAGEGRSVIASLHDLALAARWCTRLILLDGGKVISDGTPNTALTEANIRRAFGITIHSQHTQHGWIVQPLDIAKSETEG